MIMEKKEPNNLQMVFETYESSTVLYSFGWQGPLNIMALVLNSEGLFP